MTASGPNALVQLVLLLRLWWRHMRRRATRLGEAPKQSGMPTALLLNVLSTGYMALVVWRTVDTSVTKSRALFAWHMLGVVAMALGAGISKGAGRLQVRGMRNDAFLEPLPLTTLARLALQFADTFLLIPLVLTVPAAALAVSGSSAWWSLLSVALSGLSFAALFVVGQAGIAWARALGPLPTARIGGYAGVGFSLVGIATLFTPIGHWFSQAGPLAARVTDWWLQPSAAIYGLYGAALTLLVAAYQLVCWAERWGFDHLDPQSRAPKPHKGVRDRAALEWLMMSRQGGRALLVVFSALLGFVVWLVVARPTRNLPVSVYVFTAGFVIYLGALQTIAQAGRAARGDLLARPFLATLPLSPHQVLDGKASALRKLLLPVLALLAVLCGSALVRGEFAQAYRVGLALFSLYVVVDGAVSVSFLSTGIGVVGVGGGQASSGFSTQLLMMPLLATALASDAWPATTAFIAVVAITWESRRAAKQSVRWIDDPDDDAERETTVWRALLAATGFFAMQALSYRLFALFELPLGYLFAISFGSAAALLALLTWRNGARFERPRFVPSKLWYWPLGALAGAASGLLALSMVKLLPAPVDAPAPVTTTGELTAMIVTMTVMAPLVEEYFFRGWLQKAIEADLPLAHKRWAFVLGASAFALAHLGSYGVPQLVLGLAAGALFARGGGLWPSILAHAFHNGVVLLAQHH